MPKRTRKATVVDSTKTAEPITNIHMPISLDSQIALNRQTVATILLGVTILGLVGWSVRRQIMDWRSLSALSKQRQATRQSAGPRVVVTDSTNGIPGYTPTPTPSTSTPAQPVKQPQSYTIGKALKLFLSPSYTNDKEYTLSVGGSQLGTITSIFTPSVWPLSGNDLRFILQKFPTASAEISLMTVGGVNKPLLIEPDDLIYLLDKTPVSRNNDLLVYTAVSAYHQTCGGEIDQKIPNFSGATLELRAVNLDTKKVMTIMKNEHEPIAGMTEKLPSGVQVIGYSADGAKVYVAKRGAMGCGGMDNIPTYEVVLAPNGSVKQIPYKQTLSESQVITYVDSITEDGKYLYYEEFGTTSNTTKIHRIELATGVDTVTN